MTVDSFKYLSPASTAIIKSLVARAPEQELPWTVVDLPFEWSERVVSPPRELRHSLCYSVRT